MVPHPLPQRGAELAVVDADLCAGCGICAGACPSSTPFRRIATLVSGIDMPQLPVDALRRTVQRALRSPEPVPIIAFGCAHGADISCLAAADVLTVPLLCTAQLPPSFIEFALRDGARGVIVASCRDGGCEFRLGARWNAARLAGTREPYLRARVPRTRVLPVQADTGEESRLREALHVLRARAVAPGVRAAQARPVADA
jgi:coenzyme F420-reducing hydrogenase delta subunit